MFMLCYGSTCRQHLKNYARLTIKIDGLLYFFLTCIELHNKHESQSIELKGPSNNTYIKIKRPHIQHTFSQINHTHPQQRQRKSPPTKRKRCASPPPYKIVISVATQQ